MQNPSSDKPTGVPQNPSSDKPRAVPQNPSGDKPAGVPQNPSSDKPRAVPQNPSGDKPAGVPQKRQAINRDRLEADIIEHAVRVFAETGYEGASIAVIAERAGLSKQNLMYYFPTKQQLYQRVLDDVLDDWLARMDSLADGHGEPRDMLRAYIQAKLRFSREQPWASRVYAMEVIGGAQVYGAQIQARVVPLLRKDIAVFETWIAAGRMAPVNATHLMFAIWAMTQSYADFSAQMALVLDRKQLTRKDFDDAEEMITRLVLAAVALEQA